MKLYAYCHVKGEIRQEEIEVEKKVVIVPKEGPFPFLFGNSIEEEKIGTLLGIDDTVFFTSPSFETAKELFLENEKKRFSEIEESYNQKKAVLKKLEAAE